MTRTPKPLQWPTFARQVVDARAALRLPDEIGLAIRADRRRLGLSQRAYAARRRITAALVARLESRAGELKLADVILALDGTAFVLCLCHRSDPADVTARSSDPTALRPSVVLSRPAPVSPTYWPREDLVARVRSETRRFPAHHPTRQVDRPPLWWWYAEATRAFTKPPHWYAPQTGPPALDDSA